jgi:hypothetical protein
MMAAAVLVGAAGMATSPAWVLSRSHSSPSGAGVAHHAKTRPCRRSHRSSCRHGHAVQSITGTNGGLTVTFTATENGPSVTFDIASTETQASGALGPEFISFGDGTSQGFGTPEYCLAHPVAESDDTTVDHTYAQSGPVTVSVTVGANCTGDQLTLTLPVAIGSST